MSQTNIPKRKKPMNAFFLYRKQYKERIQQLYNTTKSNEISRIAGECWSTESASVKNHFRRLSQELYEKQKEEELQIASSMPVSMPVCTSPIQLSPKQRLQSRSHESFRQRMEQARSRSISSASSFPSPTFQYSTAPVFQISQDILDIQKNTQYSPFQVYQMAPIVNVTPIQSPQTTSQPFPLPFDPVYDSFVPSPATESFGFQFENTCDSNFS